MSKRIADKGGLKGHLNDPVQLAKHNGFGWVMYKLTRRLGLNVTARAQLFGVRFNTMKGWDDRFEHERKELVEQHEMDLNSFRW